MFVGELGDGCVVRVYLVINFDDGSNCFAVGVCCVTSDVFVDDPARYDDSFCPAGGEFNDLFCR